MREAGARGKKRLALALVGLGAMLTACENQDFSGVKFRPDIMRPDAYKTAVRGMAFYRQKRDVPWGNEFLHHARSLEEREFQPALGAQLTLDETKNVPTDASGLFGFDNVSGGLHGIKVRYKHRYYETVIDTPKDHLTVVAMELDDSEVAWVSTASVAHTFVALPVLNKLIDFHQEAREIVRRYNLARANGVRKEWEELVSEDYSDPQGGREDFIRAMLARARGGKIPRPLSCRTLLSGPKATLVLQTVHPAGLDFERLDLVLESGRKGGWKISSVRE